jgi:predicted secreted protein
MKLISIVLMALMTLCTISAASATTFEEHQITVKENQEFEINLGANSGSTGYQWTMQYDSNFVEFIGESAKPTNWIIPGKPINETYLFKALKPGQTKIVFTLSRPWSDEKPLQVVKYNITINKSII